MDEILDVKETEIEAENPPIVEKKKRKRFTASHLIAFWMLALTSAVSAATVYLMHLCVVLGYMGALYSLTALITLCQAGNAIVLSGYFSKSKAENTAGGITYESAMAEVDASIDSTIIRDA